MEISVSYAKERVALGVHIGSFQIIQHYLVDMSSDVDSIQWAVYHAARTLSEGLPSTHEIAVTKAWASEAYRRIVTQSHMIHAGIGFTKDHDLELYTGRKKGKNCYCYHEPPGSTKCYRRGGASRFNKCHGGFKQG